MKSRGKATDLDMKETILKQRDAICTTGAISLIAALLTGCCAVEPPGPFTQSIGTTGLKIDLIPVPAGDGVESFWMSRTEIDWDTFDAFVFDVDELPVKGTPEAETRPTRPYMLVDRGFGHAGYPAISMSRRGADSFCRWLSELTGRTWRLPTTREWTRACDLGAVSTDAMDAYAWYEANADWTTHPIATKKADALGFHDLHGNIAEWAITDKGDGVVMGGSYLSTADELGCRSSQPDTKDWNESDPQIPRSIWWLADAPFVGFRIVCDGPD